MGAPNSTFFTSLSPPLASFFFSPSASTAGLPSQCFWVWGGMALSAPSFTQIPRIDWIFWSPDVEKFSSVFVENRSCLRLSTWLRGLAPCQGLTDCKATLFQGGLLEYLVTWLPGYLVSGYLVTWLRYIAPCLDWGLAGLHSSKVGYLKEGRHLNLFICMSKHSGGSRTQEMSDKLSIYFEMNEWSWLHLPGWAKAGVTHWGSMLKMGGLLPGRRLSLTDSYSYQLLQGS